MPKENINTKPLENYIDNLLNEMTPQEVRCLLLNTFSKVKEARKTRAEQKVKEDEILTKLAELLNEYESLTNKTFHIYY